MERRRRARTLARWKTGRCIEERITSCAIVGSHTRLIAYLRRVYDRVRTAPRSLRGGRCADENNGAHLKGEISRPRLRTGHITRAVRERSMIRSNGEKKKGKEIFGAS